MAAGADLLEEHLGEIRNLRQRLEESICINDRLREQLEQRLSSAARGSGRRPAAGAAPVWGLPGGGPSVGRRRFQALPWALLPGGARLSPLRGCTPAQRGTSPQLNQPSLSPESSDFPSRLNLLT